MTYNAINDDLQGTLSGLGDPTKDRLANAKYKKTVLTDAELSAMYESSWAAGKIVDIPAYDALRKWRTWLSEKDNVDAISLLETKLKVEQKLLRCKVLARLFGGAAVYLGTNQDPTQPLDVTKIKKGDLLFLTVMSRLELSAGPLDKNPLSETYGKPEYYEVANSSIPVRIHPSHFVLQYGIDDINPWCDVTPSYGWGKSILQRAHDAVKNLDSLMQNIASLSFKSTVDVFGIPDFMNNISDPRYADKLLKRFSLASASMSINKTLIHDSAEEYSRHDASFSDLPDIIDRYLLSMSAAADVPITRFLGESPSGLSGSGESELKNYYDKVQSIQELEIDPAIDNLNECLIRSALGFRPDNITYVWNPLEQSNETEIADIGNTTADTLTKMKGLNVYTNKELRAVGTARFTELGVFPGLAEAVRATEEDVQFDFGQISNEAPTSEESENQENPESDNQQSENNADN